MKRQGRAQRRSGITVRLTGRDKAVLRALGRFRIARTSDLARYGFRDVRKDTAAARLRRLFDAGYVAVQSQGVAEENLYSLGPRGKQLLQAEGHDTWGPPRGGLEHHLGIVRSWIDLAVVVSDIPELRLRSIRPDWELRREKQGTAGLVPDLLVRLEGVDQNRGAAGFTLAVEVDCGTESLRVLKQKIRQYVVTVDPAYFGIGVVLSRAFLQRRQAVVALLRDTWPGRGGVWTVKEGPARTLGSLWKGDQQSLTGSPCCKGSSESLTADSTTGPLVRGGGL